MEINMDFKSAPKPTLGSLKAGDVFLVDEKGLHDTSRVAYMVAQQSFFNLEPGDLAVTQLSDGLLGVMRSTRQVTPVKAVLTLEVPFG